eukprot:scaffold16052_cov19-Tisochrysis_lutea.AAC.3
MPPMQTRVEGLKGVSYRDNLQQLKEEQEVQDTIRVEDEIDRIYVNAPSSIKVRLLTVNVIIALLLYLAYRAGCCHTATAWTEALLGCAINLVDEAGKRQLSIEKSGFPDA